MKLDNAHFARKASTTDVVDELHNQSHIWILNFVARQVTCFYCSCSRSKAGPSVNRPSCHSPIHSRETPKLWGYGEIGKAQRSLESNWQPPDSKSFFRVLPPPLLKFAHILGEGVAGFWKVCHNLYFHFTSYLSCASSSETFVVMQRFDTFANYWQTLAFIHRDMNLPPLRTGCKFSSPLDLIQQFVWCQHDGRLHYRKDREDEDSCEGSWRQEVNSSCQSNVPCCSRSEQFLAED